MDGWLLYLLGVLTGLAICRMVWVIDEVFKEPDERS